MIIRRKIIGVILRQARQETGRSLDEVAPALGVSPEKLARVELGEDELSLVELDALAEMLGVSFARFVSEDVLPMTTQERAQHDMDRFMRLPPEVREFVLKPINIPYLQVAMNLSQMPSDTLRQIASGLLEITY
jgi:transcriptional regulator with XRE-family HTH domain